MRILRNKVGVMSGTRGLAENAGGRLCLEQVSFRHCLQSLFVCPCITYGCTCFLMYILKKESGKEGVGGAACFVSRCFGTRRCLNTSSASFKVLPPRLSTVSVGGALRGAGPPLREPWHWWRGTRCGTRVSAGSGCSSKPGRGWHSPQRPAASRMSRTARGPG